MASLSYETIYSSLLRKISDYDFLTDSVDDVNASLAEFLRSTASKPYCRRLFSTLAFDDELQELTYELKQTTDADQDDDFVVEALALGMLIQWLEPQLNSKLLTQQMITSSKESKFYSQASHLKEVQVLYDGAVKKQRSLILDRGFIYNAYLGGTND